MGTDAPVSNALAVSLADLPDVHDRLVAGQQFNAYEIDDDDDDWIVAIGPVTNSRCLAVSDWQGANLIVDALRYATGQQPQICRAFPAPENETDRT